MADDSRLGGVDYSAIPNRVLVAAGQETCTDLAKAKGRTPDGIDLERAAYAVKDEYRFARARRKPGAEQDPGVPLRNADVRLAFAVADAAVARLCPDQPFNPAR